MKPDKRIAELYGNRLRLRVCGFCFAGDSLLLVRHRGLGEAGQLWAPPGGGAEFGLSIEESLKKEFVEETGLQIAVRDFLFAFEYLSPPLHTVELFFEVEQTGGKLQPGYDPEMPPANQIIEEVRFVSFRELRNFAPGTLHHLLKDISSREDLVRRSGLFKFEKN